MQSTLILLAPAFFAASVYMTLGRIVRSVVRAQSNEGLQGTTTTTSSRTSNGRSLVLVPVKWTTRLFVLSDILSFTIQGSGAGLMVSTGNLKLGQNIVVVGLCTQVLMFAFFGADTIFFHIRMNRRLKEQAREKEMMMIAMKTTTTTTSQRYQNTTHDNDDDKTYYNNNNAGDMLPSRTIPWRRSLSMVYVASTAILIRSVFRVVEYAAGQTGYLLRHEWTIYVFDAVPMLIVTLVFFVCYIYVPSR